VPQPHSDQSGSKEPPRGEFPPEVVAAIRTLHSVVWAGPYEPGSGPMHNAGGPYWRAELLRLARRWDRLADAARVCAQELPDA
jgi:hypothetical protein